MPRVLIGPATLIGIDGEFRKALLAAGFELVSPPRQNQMTEEELLHRLTGCEALLAGSEPVTRRVIQAHRQLRIIARSGVGYDAVDVAAATERGIPVTIAPGNSEGVAEHAMGLMIALSKGMFAQHTDIASGGWPRYSTQPMRGRSLAIIGLGRIGKALAVRALAFRMKVIAHDIAPDKAFAEKRGIPFATFDECCAADFVSLHLPLTDKTRHIMDRRRMGLMKKSAFLINTARGGVVDQAALTECLREGRIAGAALDVLEEEPPRANEPIRMLPNVLLTAHTAGVDTASRDDMALMAASTIVRFFNGEWPADVIVNPECRSIMP